MTAMDFFRHAAQGCRTSHKFPIMLVMAVVAAAAATTAWSPEPPSENKKIIADKILVENRSVEAWDTAGHWTDRDSSPYGIF